MTAAAPVSATRGSLLFIFALVLIDMIGFGIIMPVLPALIVELTGDTIAGAAVDAGWLAFVYAAMQFIFGPVMGNLSDRFGRRPVLLATLLAYSINYALMGLAPTLLWLFVGRLLAGITGASFSAAYAYVADVTPAEKRAQNFGLIGVAFGLGFIVGPALGGILGEYGTRLPFFAAGGLALANAVFGFFCLNESLPPEKRRPFSLIRSNAVSALRELGRQDKVVIWYAGALLVWMTAHMVYPIIWAFYGIEAFGWSERMVGLSLAGVGLSSAIVQGVLIRTIVPRVGERRAVMLGVGCLLAAALIYLFAEHEIWVPIAIAVGSLQGLVQPSINGLMSRAVDERSQGELQGAVASISSLSAVIGPLVYTRVFYAFTAPGAVIYLPGAAFALAGVVAIGALALFLRGNTLHGVAFIRPSPREGQGF
ncbi:TCR/Tet family MFS transporter [Pacificimonas sp. ICDLI1SI03]